MNVLILAGERPGGDPLAIAENVASKTQIVIAGEPMLAHVLRALRQLQPAPQLFISGAAGGEAGPDITVIETGPTPCSSVMKALAHISYPVLITTADHPLLTPAIIHEFLQKANSLAGDVCVGLVPLSLIEQHYPENRRTKLKFSDGSVSGANLFLLRHARAMGLLEFWRLMEANRKSPWRMVRVLGFGMLLRYAAGRLSFAQLVAHIAARTGCSIAPVMLSDPHAAIDVDKPSDLALVRAIMHTASTHQGGEQ